MVFISETQLKTFGKKGDLDSLKNFIVTKLTKEFREKNPKKAKESNLEYNRRKTAFVKSNLNKDFKKYADKVRFVYMKGKSFKSF